MQTVTVASIIARARERADATTATPTVDFVTDVELLNEVDKGYKEMLDLVISCGDAGIELLVASTVLTTPYTLPTTFYKLAGVEIPARSGTGWQELRQFNFRMRNTYVDEQFPRYRLLGGTLHFSPSTAAPSQAQVWYIPAPAALSSGDSVTVYNGWDDFIIGRVAAYICTKEDRDPSLHLMLKRDAAQRIVDACSNNNVADTQTVARVEYQREEIYDLL